MPETKAEKNPYKKPWRVVLMPEQSFVGGFNNEEAAKVDAAARTERGKTFLSKPVYAAILNPDV